MRVRELIPVHAWESIFPEWGPYQWILSTCRVQLKHEDSPPRFRTLGTPNSRLHSTYQRRWPTRPFCFRAAPPEDDPAAMFPKEPIAMALTVSVIRFPRKFIENSERYCCLWRNESVKPSSTIFLIIQSLTVFILLLLLPAHSP